MSRYLALFLLFITSGLAAQVTGTQKIPATALPGTDFVVETTINKGTTKDFMKFFQEIPEGFIASEIESQNGTFTFADGGAKIVWITPPSDETFTIKYKVTVNGGVSGTKAMPSKISYINNNERQTFEFPAASIIIGTATPVKKELPKTNPTPLAQPGVKAPIGETVPLGSTAPPTATTTTAPAKTAEPVKTTPQPEIKKETAPASTQPNTFAKVPTSALPAASGKTYKVQIGAFSAKPKIDGVPEVSTVVLDNGITKYFSGNYATYEDALKRKKEMIEKGFQGAFIVVFENGKIVK